MTDQEYSWLTNLTIACAAKTILADMDIGEEYGVPEDDYHQLHVTLKKIITQLDKRELIGETPFSLTTMIPCSAEDFEQAVNDGS